jgi:hypothetical protein
MRPRVKEEKIMIPIEAFTDIPGGTSDLIMGIK